MTKKQLNFLAVIIYMFIVFTIYIWLFILPQFAEVAYKWEVFVILLFCPLIYSGYKTLGE